MRMTDFAPWLVAASATILLLLGLVHLFYTFHGQKLHPRDPALEEAMKQGLPLLTRQTTIWKAWVGFNASHSMGAILYGLLYGYLALAHGPLLLGSPFLLATGLALLAGYVFLAKRYWFSVPYRGIAAATSLYILALIAILL